jgi:glycine cleavage system H protein
LFKKKGSLITVGLTEKALEEIGGVQSINLPVEEDEVLQDEVVAEVEGEKQAFEVIAPMDGTIEAVNDALSEEHELLESDPLDEGWIYKLRIPKEEESEEEEDEEE